MPIGFGRTQESPKVVLNTVQDIERFLSLEIKSYQDFDKELLQELKEVEDIVHNLNIIKSQFGSIEKLAFQRKELFERLFNEASRGRSHINLEECQEMIRMIQTLDSQLIPMLKEAMNRLNDFILKDTHAIYEKNLGNKIVLGRIDEEARSLMASLRILNLNINSLQESFGDIYRTVERLKGERTFKASR